MCEGTVGCPCGHIGDEGPTGVTKMDEKGWGKFVRAHLDVLVNRKKTNRKKNKVARKARNKQHRRAKVRAK